ncbi:unnamed protein product [Mytilus coruscus]|uniref:Complex 1 LYR protein domain-containing protein n=1 Tax=Mytilus coruscus TaxID=42192 RepID=A0A6J8DGQ6_MYTCO|nr:unnamed protein product [Mytilus coruscus]
MFKPKYDENTKWTLQSLEDKMIQCRSVQVISLYRKLLRKGRSLQFTDKEYYFQRIRSEFEKNKNLERKEDIQRSIEKGQVFLERNALV